MLPHVRFMQANRKGRARAMSFWHKRRARERRDCRKDNAREPGDPQDGGRERKPA